MRSDQEIKEELEKFVEVSKRDLVWKDRIHEYAASTLQMEDNR